MGETRQDELDGTALVEAIAAGQLTPREAVQGALERIEAHNDTLNAVVRVRDQALEEAEGELAEGPLHGLPILLKDLHVSVPGEPTGGGTRLLQALPRTRWTTLARRLVEAGAVVVGRTNTPEFGIMGITEPRATGVCRNPWNPEHTPGGSSGGSGSAVAARMVPIAHASDGGGSIRIPASHNGLIGLKPSRGRVPAGPLEGPGWGGLSIELAVTRTVRDTALMLDVLCAPEPGAPYAAPPPVRPYREEVGRDPGRLRIAVVPDSLLAGENDPEVRRALDEAAARAEALGHEVEIARPPIEAEELRRAYFTQVAAGVHTEVLDAAARAGVKPRPGDFEPTTWAFHRIGALLSAADLALARHHAEAAGYAWGAFFETHDVVLTPTCARPPARVGELYPDRSIERRLLAFRLPLPRNTVLDAIDTLAAQALGATPNTQLANLLGLPAISLPTAWSTDGLPIGTQWIAPLGREDVLIRLAAQLEEGTDWAARRPELVS